MSDLRAPDPTLTAVEEVAVVDTFQNPPISHRLDDDDPYRGLRCDAPGEADMQVMASRDARWFAVPCRECFPDAPEPGYVNVGGKRTALSAGLAWQVAK